MGVGNQGSRIISYMIRYKCGWKYVLGERLTNTVFSGDEKLEAGGWGW